MPVKLVNNNVFKIQKILKKVNDQEYEEAFLLSSQMIECSHSTEDALYHDWVTALTAFYTYKKREEAILLLEKVKPANLENEIHFRILNSLVVFYSVTGNKKSFLSCKDDLYSGLSNLDNKELEVLVLFNIANSYYTFKNYKMALEYTNQAIKIATKNDIANIFFSLSNILKIMCLFYLGERTKAENLKEEFFYYLKVVDKMDHNKYLENELKQFSKEG